MSNIVMIEKVEQIYMFSQWLPNDIHIFYIFHDGYIYSSAKVYKPIYPLKVDNMLFRCLGLDKTVICDFYLEENRYIVEHLEPWYIQARKDEIIVDKLLEN